MELRLLEVLAVELPVVGMIWLARAARALNAILGKVTAPFFNCFVPTLLAGRDVAAQAVPPSATNNARYPIALWVKCLPIRTGMAPSSGRVRAQFGTVRGPCQ
jgi:hypothetical protein